MRYRNPSNAQIYSISLTDTNPVSSSLSSSTLSSCGDDAMEQSVIVAIEVVIRSAHENETVVSPAQTCAR